MVSRISLAFMILAVFSLGGAAQRLPYENSPFGFHPASIGQVPTLSFREAQDIGVRWHRPPVYAFWSLVQPNRTQPAYDWSIYDLQYGLVPMGVNILANLDVEPRRNASGYSRPGSYLPVDVTTYQAFVRATVERYDGDGVDDMLRLTVPIRYWQVSNEINNRLSDFAELQRLTYTAIKDACSDCHVLIGGVGGMPDQYPGNFNGVYLPILQRLGGQYMDIFDFHWYGNATGDYRRMADALAVIRTGLQLTGFGSVLIWVTEMGTYSGNPADELFRTWPFQTEGQQAADLLKRFVYSLSLGIGKVFPAFGLIEGFKGNDGYFDHTGLIYDGFGSNDLGRGVKKLAYYTYKLMTEKLEGGDWTAVEKVREDTVNKTYIYKFTRGANSIYVAWWDYFSDATYTPGKIKQVSLTGLQASTVLVTEAVPMVSSGFEVRDYATAFRKDMLAVTNGAVMLALGENPVFVEPKTPLAAGLKSPPNPRTLNPKIEAGAGVSNQAAAGEPVYIVLMTHVEGDRGEPQDSPTCASDLRYQTDALPPRGQPPQGNSFAVDIVGTELLHEILQKYSDSTGQQPKLFIEPTGEFWQTEADPVYGGKLFQKYDYLALGYEFGVQGHGIYYSGQNFCWYTSPKTEEGIQQKLTDLHRFAENLSRDGQKVNAGLTLTPGAKIEGPVIGRARAEWVYDHVAYSLGYRVSFEDHDGHLEDEPAGINNSRSSYYLYEAVYDDGVRMLKIDFNGGVNASCQGNTPRCEKSEEAITRLDRTLAARNQDADAKRVYYFAFTVHSNGVWVDFHMAEAGLPMIGEGAGLVALMNAIQQRVNAGARIKFVTPRELREIFEQKQVQG